MQEKTNNVSSLEEIAKYNNVSLEEVAGRFKQTLASVKAYVQKLYGRDLYKAWEYEAIAKEMVKDTYKSGNARIPLI